jgi:hypothetical protein
MTTAWLVQVRAQIVCPKCRKPDDVASMEPLTLRRPWKMGCWACKHEFEIAVSTVLESENKACLPQ